MKYNRSEISFSLWNHCNNRCKFCYNQDVFYLPLNVKEYLSNCNELLNSSFIEDFDYLRFLGGELFDGSIDQLGVINEFLALMNTSCNLLKENKIEKLNFLTNLIYKDNVDLRNTLQMFYKAGVIDKIELSTSYDIAGRFNKPNSEQWWWDNIKWINDNYAGLKIYVGIVMTQQFITSVTKEWLDDMNNKINNCHIHFLELDTALTKTHKQNSPFKEFFPKRADFLKFLKNLKDWNYYDSIMEANEVDIYDVVGNIQVGYVEEFSFPIFKNQNFLLEQRETYKDDGYIDSDVPLFDDVKKVLRL